MVGHKAVKRTEVRFPQPGQRHVGREFPPLRRQSQHLANPLVDRLQTPEVGAFLNSGIERVGLAAAEHAAARQPELERPGLDTFQLIGDFAGKAVGNVADEAQCDVVALGIDPAGSGDPAPHEAQIEGNIGRNFKAGEQSRHGGPPH